jgi:hypothetical protein
MIMMNYWVQIDEDNYTIMEGEVEWLEQNLGSKSTRIAIMTMKMHVCMD